MMASLADKDVFWPRLPPFLLHAACCLLLMLTLRPEMITQIIRKQSFFTSRLSSISASRHENPPLGCPSRWRHPACQPWADASWNGPHEHGDGQGHIPCSASWFLLHHAHEQCQWGPPWALAPANQTKERAKTKSSWLSPILWILGVFLGKTNAIHIELLFRNAPRKSSWTGLSLVWFAGVTPDFCVTDVCVIGKWIPRRFMCNWHVHRKYLHKRPNCTKEFLPESPCETDALCNWEMNSQIKLPRFQFAGSVCKVFPQFHCQCMLNLPAQCEIPPYVAQCLFEIVSQEGGTICLVFMWYLASIAEIPLL